MGTSAGSGGAHRPVGRTAVGPLARQARGLPGLTGITQVLPRCTGNSLEQWSRHHGSLPRTPRLAVTLAAQPERPALIGVSTASATLSLGGGCTLQVGSLGLLLLVATNAGGFGDAPIAIPDDLALRGLPVFAQAAQLDAQSPIGVALSPQLAIVIGG